MRYEGTVYRPPSEASSLIIQLTIGCARNTCTFCAMYKDKSFRIRNLEEVVEDLEMARQYYKRIKVRRIFLADGDALIVKTADLLYIIGKCKEYFPEVERISVYGAPKDIINKIVENIYGEFLPDVTSVLLYKDAPVGFAFTNVTGGKIANIPLVAIEKEHRGHGFSEHLLNRSIKTIVDWTKLGKREFSEVNVTTETNNYKALKMYRRIGFREDFCYPQAYLMQKKKK